MAASTAKGFAPGTSAEPTTNLELSISCRDLADCDVFSKSDPICVVYLKTPEMASWREICRTEMIENTLNPDFVKKVHITYRFEVQQNLRFEVYDIDTNDSNLANQDFLGSSELSVGQENFKKFSNLANHDFLGFCETTLGKLVSNVKLTLPLESQFKKGQLIVIAEDMGQCKDEVQLQFIGRHFERKYWFFSPDPFMEFRKSCEDGEYRVVHRTEVCRWTLNPNWKRFTIPLYALCGNDKDREIKVVCYDRYRSGNHGVIGEFFTTVNKLGRGQCPENNYPLVNPNKITKTSYKNSGEVALIYYGEQRVYSFLDYIMGGTQINCTVAIDFTASNGDPTLSQSLHYIHEYQPNSYEQALSAVITIVQDYLSAKRFPVLGFGARLPPDGRVSHEFYVNLHPTDPYCDGLQGVVNAYKKCIRNIQLYGPTNFSPVIHHVIRFAEAYPDGSQYFILLIITDGVITDMEQTKQAIIRASELPISIIIVGVGDADFTAMEVLDADTVPLMSGGRVAARDIVQFVPFSQFKGPYANIKLAEEVLKEVPDQLVGYMKSKFIKPLKQPSAPSHPS